MSSPFWTESICPLIVRLVPTGRTRRWGALMLGGAVIIGATGSAAAQPTAAELTDRSPAAFAIEEAGPSRAVERPASRRTRLDDPWPPSFALALLPPDADEHRDAGTNLPKVSRRTFELTNEARTERGRNALAWEDHLARIACRHNKDMLAHDYMDHEDSDGRGVSERGAREHRTLVGTLGENVYEAWGQEEWGKGASSKIVESWMKSPGHRENILRQKFTHLGVCVTQSGKNMRATQVFASVEGWLDDALPWSVAAGDSLQTTVSSPSSAGVDRYAFVRPDNVRDYSFDQTVPFDGKIRYPKEPGRYRLVVLVVEKKEGGRSRYSGHFGPQVHVEMP